MELGITVGAETLAPGPRTPLPTRSTRRTSTERCERVSRHITTTQTKSGRLTINSGFGRGIDATSGEAGGHFKHTTGSGEAFAGYGEVGLQGYGDGVGVKALGGVGVQAEGGFAGVSAYGDVGVVGQGNAFGGAFYNTDLNGGYVSLGLASNALIAEVGSAGGYAARIRHDANGGEVYIGTQDQSLFAYRPSGEVLRAYSPAAGIAVAGESETGTAVTGFGDTGGFFASKTTSATSSLGFSTFKILGTGSVSFIQNHPYEKDKVIVYAAPEGDEVAVYTRGSGRLVNGEARIALGKTFAWVANPDIGLTAHLTARGAWADLYVASLSSQELVVSSRSGDPDAAFDYMVHGLRVGFEEVSIVQEKRAESYIPSMAEHRARYDRNPGLRAFNALERFKAMRGEDGADTVVDTARSRALRDAVHEYDPALDAPVDRILGLPAGRNRLPANGSPLPDGATSMLREAASRADRTGSAIPAAKAGSRPVAPAASLLPDMDDVQKEREAGARTPSSMPLPPDLRARPDAVMIPVEESVEAGDVLVADPNGPGSLRRGFVAADPAVVGIAVGSSVEGHVPLPRRRPVSSVEGGDAGAGPIRPGDLLTTSTVPGQAAMKAQDALMGTILGKALEPLDEGARVIRVLLTVR